MIVILVILVMVILVRVIGLWGARSMMYFLAKPSAESSRLSGGLSTLVTMT